MTVPVQVPSTLAVANGVSTVFPFAFLVQRQASLVVLVGGIVQIDGSDFAVSGLGLEEGGTVTFYSPPAAGALVTILRQTALRRDYDYQTNGNLLADTIDDDIDDVWLALQELNAKIVGAIGGGGVGGGAVIPIADLLARLAQSDGATLIGYLASATGAVASTVALTLDDQPVNAFKFLTPTQRLAVKNGTASGVAYLNAFQKFVDACAYGRGYIPPCKWPLVDSVVFDPTKSTCIEGACFDIFFQKGTTLLGTGATPVFVLDNATANNYNPDIRLKGFGISGSNTFGQHGIYARRTPIKVADVCIANCQDGIRLTFGYGSRFTDVISSNNYQHGINLDRQANQVTVDHCVLNANSRGGGGFAGLAVIGALNFENYAVKVTNTDCTSNGRGSGTPGGGTGNGIIIQHTRGISIDTPYSETNKTFAIYADNTVFGLSVRTGSYDDEEVQFAAVGDVEFAFSRIEGYGAFPAKLTVTGAPATDIRVHGISYGGTTPVSHSAMTANAGETREFVNSAPPSATGITGSYRQGDICKHRSPVATSESAWVCTAPGVVGVSTGTWRVVSTVS